MSGWDAVELERFHHLMGGIAEEMGAALMRSAYSPNIKERRDFSCALFDRRGRMIAQGENIPVHLGSMPASVEAALASRPPAPGEMVLVNDPFHGGTHLPDLTLVAPFHPGEERAAAFFVASRAHHADIGGMSPGSMPLAREIFQEGLVIPPVRLIRAGEVDTDVLALVLANVRTAAERQGDLEAQVAACRLGQRRLAELAAEHGLAQLETRGAQLLAYSERLMRAVVAAIPDGEYAFQDRLDDDGAGGPPVRLRVRIRVAGDRAEVDFAGSDPQVPGGVNAVAAITRSAVHYAFRCLAGERILSNHGCQVPIKVQVPVGSVLDARPPAAVAAGNVETSQRVVDLVLGALAAALPERIPAASQGTMNNLSFGGTDPRNGLRFAYYETVGGGCGGGPAGPGASGIHSHMTNSWNTPVEALEHAYPVRVRRYGLRRGSGGAGRHPGGDGVVREIEFCAEAELSLLAERRRFAPWGLAGGSAGAPGRARLSPTAGAPWEELPGKCQRRVRPGARLVLETPGGGGWGEPRQEPEP